MNEKYFGKYRGVVINNNDPEQKGRVQAQVFDVGGSAPLAWAMPCVPCHLPKEVGSALPAIGANVWIEFEGGDLDYPIWTGCWFGTVAETPPALRRI
jgi:hypothetical protein